MAATSDLIYSKLAARYPTEEKTLGGLLRRYRADNNLPTYEQYRDHVTPSALYVPGDQGVSYASTPDHASFALTDVDVRILAVLNNWGADSVTNQFAGQWALSVPPDVTGWVMSIHGNKKGRFAISQDGGLIGHGLETDELFSYSPRELHWYRNTYDSDNGAGGNTCVHYVGDYSGTTTPTWNQFGTPRVESGISVPFNSTMALRTNWLFWGGYFLYVELRSTINGSIVANPDFRTQTPGTTSFADSTGKTWTLTGNAKIVKAPIPVTDAENAFWDAFVP